MKKDTMENKIDALTRVIEKLVNNPIAPIAPVAPVAPVLPLIPINAGDHDLLTKLDAKVDQIQSDVTELKKQGSIYVTQSEHAELIKKVEKNEKNINELQTTKNTQTVLLTIGCALLTLLSSLVIYHLLGKGV